MLNQLIMSYSRRVIYCMQQWMLSSEQHYQNQCMCLGMLFFMYIWPIYIGRDPGKGITRDLKEREKRIFCYLHIPSLDLQLNFLRHGTTLYLTNLISLNSQICNCSQIIANGTSFNISFFFSRTCSCQREEKMVCFAAHDAVARRGSPDDKSKTGGCLPATLILG